MIVQFLHQDICQRLKPPLDGAHLGHDWFIYRFLTPQVSPQVRQRTDLHHIILPNPLERIVQKFYGTQELLL